jgi:DNA polymerase II small subunit
LLVPNLEGTDLEEVTELQKAVSAIIGAGFQIDKEAFNFLRDESNKLDIETLVKNAIDELQKLPEKELFVSRELLVKKADELRYKPSSSTPSITTGKGRFQPFAKEIDADLTIVEDSSSHIGATGSIENYLEYFQDRFTRLNKIIKSRLDVRDASTIIDAFKAPMNSKVKVICMITEKRETGRGVVLQIEDLEASATVFVTRTNGELLQKAQKLVLDQIVCLCVAKGRDNFFVAEDIVVPDIPSKKPNKASIPVYAALISDLHIGSNVYLADAFQRFILWLKGEVGNNRLREIAGHIKYVVIAGDIVDGIGIYPNQINELEIQDIYEQYKAAAEVIREIPDYIEVVIIPGNHDAVRRALPQPSLSKEYAEPLLESRKIYSLGNPSSISLHGVNVLLSHGRSLDDVISTVPKMSFQKPDEAMKFLLQSRHLAPTYGSRALMAPEKKDYLVIEKVPDIFHAGHVHMMSFSNYRGTLIVNSGAWQGQTEYQREMGHTPNPGIAPIVNLQTLEVVPINFAAS